MLKSVFFWLEQQAFETDFPLYLNLTPTSIDKRIYFRLIFTLRKDYIIICAYDAQKFFSVFCLQVQQNLRSLPIIPETSILFLFFGS